MTNPSHRPAANWRLESDLEDILFRCQGIWPSLQNGHLFITGGTGFIGRWLIEALHHANQRLGLNLRVTLLSRNPEAFKKKCPHLFSDGYLSTLRGDVSSMLPHAEYSHLIHAATDASADLNETAPLTVFNTIVQGTDNVLQLSSRLPKSRTLFLSSGAVYGQQPANLEKVQETWSGSPDPQAPRNAYAEAKRAAEMLCSIYRKQFGVDVTSARIFSLLGPFLPLNIHFAAGNFIRDALAKQSIIVKGNGLPVRSYLYPSDLVVALLTLLTQRGNAPAYNLGSERGYSIAELARTIAETIGTGEYQVLGATDGGWNVGRYVPDTTLLREEFSLTETVSLTESIRRTAQSYGWVSP